MAVLLTDTAKISFDDINFILLRPFHDFHSHIIDLLLLIPAKKDKVIGSGHIGIRLPLFLKAENSLCGSSQNLESSRCQ